jgi:hypothetical protein
MDDDLLANSLKDYLENNQINNNYYENLDYLNTDGNLVNSRKVFATILEDKNKLIEEYQIFIKESELKHRNELMKKDFEVN